MDIYGILDFKVVDTSSAFMRSYNWFYQPFNAIEGLIWFAYALKTIRTYRGRCGSGLLWLQCTAFVLFGLSDFMELQATSVLLILFKGAILLALIAGHQAILRDARQRASIPNGT